MTLFGHFLNLLFPSHCVRCGQHNTYLCFECSQKIDKPFGQLDGITSVFSYQDPKIKHLLWRLKFKGTFSIAETFGAYLYDAIMEDLSEKSFFDTNVKKIVLLPIPLSQNRYQQRGFNQAEKLSRALYNNDKDFFSIESNLLEKIKDNPPQSKIQRKSEREKNMRGCFRVKKIDGVNKLKDCLVIIVDDITTTGATIYEARKVLRQAGIKNVIALTVAH